MQQNGTRPKRDSNLLVFSYIKQALQGLFSTQVLKVTLDKKQEGEIASKIDDVIAGIERLKNQKVEFPSTEISFETGAEESLKQVTDSLEQLQSLLTTLPASLEVIKEQLGALKEKDMVVNVPPVVIPPVQQVKGDVTVKNIPSMPNLSVLDEIARKLDGVQQAIGAIKFPEQKEVKFPAFAFPQPPDSVSVKEGKAILSLLQNVEKALVDLPAKLPQVEFPKTVSVNNFPPQKYPMPVTHMSINSLKGFVKTTAINIGAGLSPLPGEVLANRRSLIVYNNSLATIEIGGSEFTFGNGLPVPAGAFSPSFDAGPNMVLYGRTSGGTANVRILEVSDERSGR
jgi:hypothetical protein